MTTKRSAKPDFTQRVFLLAEAEGMRTQPQWHLLDEGPLGTLEFERLGRNPALELHLWQRDESGRTTAVWLDEDGNVLRVERAGLA